MTDKQNLQDASAQALIKMIDITVQNMSDVIAFSKQQIPEVIHQLLMWNLIESLTWFCVALLSTYPVCRFLRNQATRKPLNNSFRDYKVTMVYDSSGRQHAGVIVYILLCLAYGVFSLSALTDLTWLKIWIAPKLYLLEYGAKLISK